MKNTNTITIACMNIVKHLANLDMTGEDYYNLLEQWRKLIQTYRAVGLTISAALIEEFIETLEERVREYTEGSIMQEEWPEPIEKVSEHKRMLL